MKFVAREARRGKKYDAIIMDPPAYGRGAGGEMWKLDTHLNLLLDDCRQLLQRAPALFPDQQLRLAPRAAWAVEFAAGPHSLRWWKIQRR